MSAIGDRLKALFGTAWHVNSPAICEGIATEITNAADAAPDVTPGTVAASKVVVVDASKNVAGFGNVSAGGNILTSGGGMGYGTGAGGAVTQLTSRTTAVTLNTNCGQITTNNASLAGGATAKFTVNNSQVAATDTVDVALQSGSTTDQTDVKVQGVRAGAFDIVVANRHGSTAETAALVLNFAITKGVAA